MEKVILVEPEIPENTGFTARLAANFDADIRLVDPKFNLAEARKTANDCQNKLREAQIFESVEEAVEDLDHVIGTKPRRGTGLEEFQPRENMSLMIGRESSGLKNSELEQCDSVVHIKTGEYSSLNQSHATAILMHKLHNGEKEKAGTNGFEVIEEATGEKTVELLKRAAPTQKEIRAAISEIKSRN